MTQKAWTLLLSLSAIWGVSFVLIEIGVAYVSVFTMVWLRVGIAGLSLLFYLYLTGQRLPASWRFWSAAIIMGILNHIIPFSLIAWGQLSITAGLAAILNANTAFAGVIMAALFVASEPLRRHRLIGVIIGMAGVVFVIGPETLQELTIGSLSQLAVITATFSYALAGVWGKLRLADYPPLHLACATTLSATICLTPLLYIDPHFRLPTSISIEFIAAMIALGGVGTAVAYGLFYRILALAGAGNLSLVTIIVPVFAVMIDGLFLDRWIGPEAIAGFLIVAVGLAVVDGRLVAIITRRLTS